MMSDLDLRPASVADGADVWEMLQEFPPTENGFHNPSVDVARSEFRQFLARLERESRGEALRPGFVAQTTFWAFASGRPVGIAKVRHELTDALRLTGGHIGYGIRPSARGRGYGNMILASALLEARAIGVARILVTINTENVASIRVAEANGGRLERIHDGKHYYWF
jgi:predicted acetyltransferase